MFKRLPGLALALAASLTAAPAQAALVPSVSITVGVPVGGSPGANRTIHGFITLSPTDTYVTGGLTLIPQQMGFSNQIAYMQLGSPSGAYEVYGTAAGGVATIRFLAPLSGTSNVSSGATTKVVTPGAALTANTPILCSLNDGATGGGGTGTWPVTDAVSTCDYTSATTFTLTVISAAPTGGGNFVWTLPNVSGEIPAGSAVGSIVIPFVANGT